jgi:hypothetical protein
VREWSRREENGMRELLTTLRARLARLRPGDEARRREAEALAEDFFANMPDWGTSAEAQEWVRSAERELEYRKAADRADYEEWRDLRL